MKLNLACRQRCTNHQCFTRIVPKSHKLNSCAVRRASCPSWRVPAAPPGQEAVPTQDARTLRLLAHDLEEHCSTLGNGSYARECQKLHGWYTRKIANLETTMAQDPSTPAHREAEGARETLRQLAMCGSSITEIYHGLQVMKHLEEGYKPIPRQPDPPPAPYSRDPDTRTILASVFRRADADNNGLLTWNEFSNALHFINDDLTEDEQELVGSALDLQGHVTLEQFLAIVESAEAARTAPTSDANFLRHLMHHQPSDLDHIRNT